MRSQVAARAIVAYAVGTVALIVCSSGCTHGGTSRTMASDDDFYVPVVSCRTIAFRLLHPTAHMRLMGDLSANVSGLVPAWQEMFLGATFENEKRVAYRVWGYGSLSGCVIIDSPEDAIEFFRFFSSEDTWHYVPISEYEVYPDATEPVQEHLPIYRPAIPETLWRDSGVPEPAARKVGEQYEVSRFVVVEDECADKLRLYHVVDRIGPCGDGYVRVSKEEVVPVPAFLEAVRLPGFF